MQTSFDNGDPRHDYFHAGRLIPAFIVIGIGVVFLLNNLHIIEAQEIWRYWPVFLIVAGAYRVADSATPNGRIGGGITLAVGAAFLADNLGLLPINVWDLWPVLLIGLGLLMIIDRSFLSNATSRRRFMGSTYFDNRFGPGLRRESAVFGGGRRVYTGEFTGAKIDAVFSGYEIDLRQAFIPGDSATLKLDAVFGGIEVQIPQSWSAVVKGDGVFGAFTDNTLQPNPALNPKKLIVKGAAVFGGVDIKN